MHALAALFFLLPTVAEPPVSLTASDGTGLALTGYDVDTVIVGPLAFTELRLAFDNPQNRVIEGRFRLVLPEGAAISRFAMKIDGQYQEGEVVEKQAARRAYEDALHRNQDPALLEQASPTEFSARVFPIPAKGRKELIVSWSQELPSSSAPWRLALQGLPEIGQFKARVRQGGQEVIAQKKARYVPSADLVVPPSSSSSPSAAGVLRAGDVVVARVKPTLSAAAVDLPGTIILLDTSASRGLGERGDRQLVGQLVKKLLAAQPSLSSTTLSVLAFDQVTAPLYSGTFGAFTDAKLTARRALGASDLAGAFAAAAAIAKDKSLGRVILISDGVVTAGKDGDALVQSMSALKAAGVKRMDAVAVGALADNATLRLLVSQTLPQEGVVLPAAGAVDVDRLAARLRLQAKSKLAVEVKGATWVWPRELNGVQPGDEFMVTAELPAPIAKVDITVGGSAVTVGATDTSAPAPMLRRAWARAKIERLQAARAQEQSAAAKKELAEQIVKVSVDHRVLSSLTALVVLETEADYARFGIARNALTDILVINDQGLALMKRTAIVVPQPIKAPEPPKQRSEKSATKKKSMSRDDSAAKSAADADGDALADSADEESESSPAEGGAQAPSRSAGRSSPPPPPSARAPSAPSPAPQAEPVPVMASESERSRERRAPADMAASEDRAEVQAPPKVEPYTGTFLEVMKLLRAKNMNAAEQKARGWREENKGDILALLALGEVYEAKGDVVEAGRAYGALIDLYADRADIRRLAGARLDRLSAKNTAAKALWPLAEDTWRRAAQDRPDHPQGPRGYAWSLARQGRYAEAMVVIDEARTRGQPSGRFAGVDRILNDDLALMAAAWAGAEPSRKPELEKRLKAAGVPWESAPSLRFVLWWETDANDVDFHIHDGKKNHAYYSQRDLKTGGSLYADVTTGFGPECFTIPNAPTAYPYRLEAHYYSRGPMGFGMGAMRVVQHDGKGGIVVEDRPFIIMVDGAYVDLGVVKGPLK
jgi:tetratricopeptide (TPR) repeat protein